MLLKWTRRIIWFGLFTFNIIVGLCCIYYYFTQKTLPNVEILKNVSYEIPLRIYSADGKLIGEFGEKRRIPLRFNDIPQNIKNAFLATEDARFFQHNGTYLFHLYTRYHLCDKNRHEEPLQYLRD